jgi:hypothetical protein
MDFPLSKYNIENIAWQFKLFELVISKTFFNNFHANFNLGRTI